MVQHESSGNSAQPGFTRVSTALTPTMLAWVQAEAKEAGVSMSTFIRLKVSEARKREAQS